jgi:hypothetical protein
MELSRRNLLVGLAATAALGTVGSPIAAVAQTPPEDPDLDSFVQLSSELTGIPAIKLSPNIDPVNVKSQYLKKAKDARPEVFQRMLQIYDKNKADPEVGNIIMNLSGEDVRFLARSIILAWYLGAWYDPALLQKHSYRAADSPKYYYTARRYSAEALIPFEVISPAAYTQGWVWRVAQAHPMGYSELQFGNWSTEPPELEKFISMT